MDLFDEFDKLYRSLLDGPLSKQSPPPGDLQITEELGKFLPWNDEADTFEEHLLSKDHADFITAAFRKLRPHLHWKRFDFEVEDRCGSIKTPQAEKPRPTPSAPCMPDAVKLATGLRGYEQSFGFSVPMLQEILGPLGEVTSQECFETLEDLLPTRLPGLLPGCYYHYDMHILAECLAAHIGRAATVLPDVQEVCTDVIRRVTRMDGPGDCPSFYLGEYIQQADRYLAEHPDDALAIAWRAELTCYQGLDVEAERRAKALWNRIESADARTISRLLWFFAIADDDELRWEEPFGRPTEPEHCRHLGKRWDWWYGREEPFATALLRNAVDRGLWNDADVLRAALALAESPGHGVFNSPNILPPESWLWIAEKGLDGGRYYSLWRQEVAYLESYYACWQNIWLACEPVSPIGLLSSIVLLAARTINADSMYRVLRFKCSFREMLDRLDTIAATGPLREQVKTAIGRAVAIASAGGLNHLSADDVKSLGDLHKKLGVRGADAASNGDAGGLGQLVDTQHRNNERRNRKSKCRNYVSGHLTPFFERLCEKAIEHLVNGELSYQEQIDCDPDERDFAKASLYFFDGMLDELIARLWTPLNNEGVVRRLDLGPERNWSDIQKLIQNICDGKLRSNEYALLARFRIRPTDFPAMLDDVGWAMKRRNQVGHREIVRDGAPDHERLFDQGALRRIIAPLHGYSTYRNR